MPRSTNQKQRRNINDRQKRVAIKTKLRTLLSHNPCVVCGEDNIHTLEFDHVDPNSKTDSISRMAAIPKNYATIEAELAKCQVLCTCCHRKKTASEQLRYNVLTDESTWKESKNRYYKSRIVKQLLKYLEGKSCVQCGECDPVALDFDHLDPSIKHDTISNMISSCHSWAKIERELNKCQVLCANCHKLKTLAATRPAVYIASGMQNKAIVESLTRELEINDIVITYKWFKHGRYTTVSDRQRAAINEVNGIKAADTVLVLLPGGRGTHFELGCAIGLGKNVLIHSLDGKWADDKGERCAFYSLQSIKTIPSLVGITELIYSLSKPNHGQC